MAEVANVCKMAEVVHFIRNHRRSMFNYDIYHTIDKVTGISSFKHSVSV